MADGSFARLYPEDYLERFLAEGVRPDGRSLTTTRGLSVHAPPVSSAPGSAVAKIGNTTVITSCRLDPASEEGGAGTIDHSLDTGPLGSTRNSSVARTRQEAAAISRRIRRVLSRAVDPRGLLSGRRSDRGRDGGDDGGQGWSVKVKSVCVSLDGCLFDATLASVVAALETLSLPVAESHGEDGAAPEGTQQPAVAFRGAVTGLTLAIYGGRVLADPTREEEALASAVVSVVVLVKLEVEDEEDEILSVEAEAKGQRGDPLEGLAVQRCLGIATRRARERMAMAAASTTNTAMAG